MLRGVLPALYATMIITLTIFSFSFHDSLPLWLSVYVPLLMLSFMFMRMTYWYKSYRRGPEPKLRVIRNDLASVSWVTPIMTLSYSMLAVLPPSNVDQFQLTVAIMVVWSVSLIASFSLSTLPVSSVMIVLCATIPISINFEIYNDASVAPMTTVFITLSLLVTYTNNVTYRTFVETIVSQWRLTRKNVSIKKEREVARLIAFTDILTGLPNRRSFHDALEDKIRLYAAKKVMPFAVAIIDLDGFKPVNDVHGHATGDAVLVEVGKRLKETLGNGGFVARLGGDEFAIIADNITTESEAIFLGDKLCESLRPGYAIESVNAHLSGSCGFCLIRNKKAKPSCILERADLALYKSKSENRGGTVVFSKEMADKVLQHSKIEQALRVAINQNAIDVHFQPIVDLESKKIIGMEALARWDHPQLGSVSPARFIPIAEQSGLISELTENLFRKAIVAAKTWPGDIFLSFNLSAAHLTRLSVGMNILSIMLRQEFSPHRLEIEVTETAIMRDLERAHSTISNLKLAGIKISLDDFGTGYSSMSQVKDLPFDKIKIDKSFIDGVCNSKRTRKLILSIVDMCKNLDISCLAEGIENEEQRQVLVEMGCAMGQGYLFGKSMTDVETIRLFGNRAEPLQKMSA